MNEHPTNRKTVPDNENTAIFGDDNNQSIVYRITHLGVLLVSGSDAEPFLQGQTTCDVSGLTEHGSSLGALCNPKGRVITTFTILKTSDSTYFLLLAAELLEAVRQRLQPYVLRSDVKLSDITDRWCLVGLSGQHLTPSLSEQNIDLPDRIGSVTRQVDCITIRARATGPRFLILASPAKTVALWDNLTDNHHFFEHDSASWMCQEISDGIPHITEATTEAFVPQMINLDLLGGISLDKGCYTGQEVVARMHYLGKLKRRMYLGSSGGSAPNPGDPVFFAQADDGHRAGTIVMAARCAPDRIRLLAVLQIASADSDNLRINAPDGEPMALQSLPYDVQPQ